MAKAGQKTMRQEPVIDQPSATSGIRRLVLLAMALVVGITSLSIFGKDYIGEQMLFAILGAFAAVGVFFLLALMIGLIQLSSSVQSAEFSKDLVDEMGAGIIVVDDAGRILYANRSYADLIGAEGPSEVSSVEAVFSKHPEVSDAIYRLANLAKSGTSGSEEVRLSRGLAASVEGARWFRIHVRSMTSDVSEKPLSVWQISDVTDHRNKQESAFQQLQNAVHYLDHAPAGFMSSEPNGSLVYINATLADWLGLDLTRFEPGSKTIRDLVTSEGEALLASVEASEDGPSIAIIDTDMAKSDGMRLPVRLYHKVTPAVDGAPGTLRTLVLNRTIDWDDNIALRDAELRFTRFFNNTPIAIAGLDEEGKIVRTNAPFLRMFQSIGDKHSGVANLDCEKIVAEDDRGRFAEIFKAALEGQARINPLDVAVDDDGDRHIRLFVSPVSDGVADDDASTNEEATKERVIIYAMETTEQRALEQQFAQGQKMQAVGQLAGGVAHDFNNVLTAIIGFSDLLLANHRPSDPSFKDIMNIKQNANRAASLVRQLLAFSRRQTLRPQVLHLSDVLSDLRMLLDRLLGEKVSLEVVHGRDLWPVKVDISQFEQVVVNLAVNARDAMEDGGKLIIRTRNLSEEDCAKTFDHQGMPSADYVLLEVVDEGTGMSPKVLEKIFEPFFSTKDVGKGTGLGLSTVYGIIKQTGGFIYPVSREGKGTTFQVFLPRHIPTEAEIAAEVPVDAKKEKSKDLTGNATILLVEDEDAVRAFGSRALTSRGYTVHEASSGVEALEVMEDYKDDIDLIVSDVVMPEMDGPTLLREIRKTDPDMKFIFVSGYAEEAFAKNLPEEEREKFGFLPKPFSLKQLATTVREMLDA